MFDEHRQLVRMFTQIRKVHAVTVLKLQQKRRARHVSGGYSCAVALSEPELLETLLRSLRANAASGSPEALNASR